MSMTDILSNVSSIVTAMISWVGQFANAITGNPIILIFALTGLVFLGLNSVRKLMNV